jgi:hypothetical protein
MNPMDHLPQGMRDRVAADEKREAAEFEARQVEKGYAQETASRMAQARENSLIYQTGHSSDEWREAAQRAAAGREMRDMQAEYGSVSRQAVFVDGRALAPREQVTTAQRSGWTTDLGRVTRARQDEFMARMVREYDERQAARSARTVTRSGDGVSCVDCIAVGASAEESFLLHHDPDDPLPETRVPDHAPATRKRSGSARVPMIYR